jgi:hypothetical protein
MNVTATANGIDGTAGVNGANINRNNIAGTVGYNGINILGFGDININNNQCSSTVNASGTGIMVTMAKQQFSEVEINNNSCVGFSGSIDVTPQLNPATATGNVTIAGNTVSGFGALGIGWVTGIPGSLVQIIDNTILNTVGTGGFNDGIFIDLNQTGNAGTVIMNNNTILTTTSSRSDGIHATVTLTNMTNTRFEIANNFVQTGNGAGSNGITVSGSPNGTMCLSLFDNTIETNNTANDSILITGTGTINIDNFSGNTGINIETNTGTPVNLVPAGTCADGSF